MRTVIAGPSPGSRRFAESLAATMGARLVVVEHKVFPDGERYVRIPDPLESEVVIVQTLSPPQDSSIIEALLLADAAEGQGAESLTLTAPYMAYSRQDRRFLPGEPVSIAAIMKAFASAGYTRLITIEIHKEETLRYYPGEAFSLSPYRYMAERLRDKLPPNPIVLAPDLGALRRAREMAEALGVEYDYLVKHRDRVTGEITIEPKELDAAGRDVIIVDDIISTGGTIARAASLLLANGARSVIVVVAHALLAGNAVEKLERAGVQKVYAANTLPPKGSGLVEYVDVAPLVGDLLARVNAEA